MGGYTLSGVSIGFDEVRRDAEVRISIYTAYSNGAPNTLLYRLTNPSSIKSYQRNTFTAPENATLDEESHYAVVMENGSTDQNNLYNVRVLTASTSPPGFRAEGWYIDRNGREKQNEGGFFISERRFKIAIIGRLNNYPPDFGGTTAERSVVEEIERANVGAPVAATDREGHALTYTLEGPDADHFTIDPSTGQIRTRVALDRETRHTYSVTVRADDGNNGTSTIAVTITVTDTDEDTWVPHVEARARARGWMTLSWVPPPNLAGHVITSYRIEVSTDGTNFRELSVQSNPNVTQFEYNTGLPAGHTLYYRVTAVFVGIGPGAASNFVSATTEGEPEVKLSRSSLVLNEESSAAYTVKLNNPPSSAVTVTIVSDNADVSVSPASLLFRPDDWYAPQSVTVRALQDAEDDHETATVTHRASDPNYLPGRLQIEVRDPDHPTFGSVTAEFHYPANPVRNPPGVHFGEPFDVWVRFFPHAMIGGTQGDGRLSNMIGPDRGIRVTGATVESAETISGARIAKLRIAPTGFGDVTLTLEPMPCNALGALCSNTHSGLKERVTDTLRGIDRPPAAPRDVRAETVQIDGYENMRVTFDGTDDARTYRVQWKRDFQDWSQAREHSNWRNKVPGERQWGVTKRVEPALAYDARVRWENPNGAGPWTYTTRAGLPVAQWGETAIWRKAGGRTEVYHTLHPRPRPEVEARPGPAPV